MGARLAHADDQGPLVLEGDVAGAAGGVLNSSQAKTDVATALQDAMTIAADTAAGALVPGAAAASAAPAAKAAINISAAAAQLANSALLANEAPAIIAAEAGLAAVMSTRASMVVIGRYQWSVSVHQMKARLLSVQASAEMDSSHLKTWKSG